MLDSSYMKSMSEEYTFTADLQHDNVTIQIFISAQNPIIAYNTVIFLTDTNFGC